MRFPNKPNLKNKTVIIGLADGYSWNPLLALPRNMQCPCGSEKKFKNCHQPKLPKAIPTAMADQFKKDLDRAGSYSQIRFTEDELPDEEAKKHLA